MWNYKHTAATDDVTDETDVSSGIWIELRIPAVKTRAIYTTLDL